MAHIVVGIIPDISYRGFHNAVDANAFVVREAGWQTAAIRISPTGISETVSAIDAVWNRINPDYPIERIFRRGKRYRIKQCTI